MAVGNDLSCGLIGGIFHRRSSSPRKSALPYLPPNKEIKKQSVAGEEERRPDTVSISGKPPALPKQANEKAGTKPTVVSPRASISTALPRANSGNIVALNHMRKRRLPESDGKSPRCKTYGGSMVLAGNVLGRSPRRICRDPTRRIEPEALKTRGNEEYGQGRFEEALALYNRAIGLDPSKACYHSNKAAALIGLGRLVEAAYSCGEAIRIESCYHRAHHRLATVYLRLGEAEKALSHFTYSGVKPDSEHIAQAQALRTRLSNCAKARESGDWNTLLGETQRAMSTGADSAPQIYALRAEALLKLHRHQDAHATFANGPRFENGTCIEFFGPRINAYLLLVQAQLHMAVGRLDEALVSALDAVRQDSADKVEANSILVKVRSVAVARLRGNRLFEAGKYFEACVAYCEGLEYEPRNSLLLCNRAACRSKLGQFEKAVEDCAAALAVRPSYSKARLRRAHCNAMLERWEASIQDYEMLIRETPGDEEVGRALFEVQMQLKKQRGEDVGNMKFGSNFFSVTTKDRFRYFVTSPGMSVVLFCNKTCQKQALQLLEHICKRYPSVNFLKVEVEDHPYLVKSEDVNSVPAFKIYRNGWRVKEVPGINRQLLESSVKLYSN